MRIGAPKESKETLFRNIMVSLVWKRIEANERRETDAAGVGVIWKSGIWSPKL